MEFNGKMPSSVNTSDSSVIIQLQDISDANYEILMKTTAQISGIWEG